MCMSIIEIFATLISISVFTLLAIILTWHMLGQFIGDGVALRYFIQPIHMIEHISVAVKFVAHNKKNCLKKIIRKWRLL